MTKIGVLALQGDFEEHAQRLRALGCETFELRSAADLDEAFDGLVLPGGESTVQAALLEEFAMREPLLRMIERGIPVFATCAGLVLLAQEVEHTNGSREDRKEALLEQGCSLRTDAAPESVGRNLESAGRVPGALATLPVCVRRNAYGRQLASSHKVAPFRADEDVPLEEAPSIPMTFIRAPQIIEVGEGVHVLAKEEKAVVAVRFGNQLGITFHPELDTDDTIYQLFLRMIGECDRA